MIKINKIQLNNFRFFIDDEANNTFEPNGENMLIYGENGSGKSSIFKAFEFLAKIPNQNISDEFSKNKNIFKIDEDSSIDFEFSNNEPLTINDDSDKNDDFVFINNLAVFLPMLNYQKLLLLSFQEPMDVLGIDNATLNFDPETGFLVTKDRPKNLYNFFKKILRNYPINVNGKKYLREIEDDEVRYEEFRKIIQDELLDDINLFLKKFYKRFYISNIKLSGIGKTAYLEIEYFDKKIEQYYNFLNEARLSALAISIYLAIIKKQFSLLDDDALKILVLDDLLISLDMNNRLKLIDIFKSEFSDFQIFFFTHDKGLFETLKDKMKWKSYEIYTDIANDGYEIPFIKKSNSLLEQAKYYKLKRSYDCSANLLRQCTEKLLCKILPADKLTSKDCKNLDLSALLDVGISFEKTKDNKNQDIIDILLDLQTYRKILFNPSSHYNDNNIYKDELQGAITSLDKLIKGSGNNQL